MPVRFSYILILFIWATTPLSIKLSSDALTPVVALTFRVALAFVVGSLFCTLFDRPGLAIRRHWLVYFVGSIGLFPNMLLVYTASQYLSSGLVSLLFGLSPFFTLLLAKPLLGENLFSKRKLFALSLALIGLLIILIDDITLKKNAYLGIGLMMLSNLFFSGSTLWLKKLNTLWSVHPLEQALGAMLFSLPGLCLCSLLVAGQKPITFTPSALISLLYLSLIGSLVGFIAYYDILKKCSVEAVTLIPLITPILALLLGVTAAGEVISRNLILGATLILLALAIHQNQIPLIRLHLSKFSDK